MISGFLQRTVLFTFLDLESFSNRVNCFSALYSHIPSDFTTCFFFGPAHWISEAILAELSQLDRYSHMWLLKLKSFYNVLLTDAQLIDVTISLM